MKIILILFGMMWTGITKAQNKEAVKPQLKQIALIKIYIGYLEKGYDIARRGLNTISDIKNGHWKLDIDFFNSLKNVNPKIKNYIKVATIIDYQLRIIKECGQIKKQRFNDDEVLYIKSVADHLVSQSGILIDQLAAISTDSKLQMSDDERVTTHDSNYAEVLDQYRLIHAFSN